MFLRTDTRDTGQRQSLAEKDITDMELVGLIEYFSNRGGEVLRGLRGFLWHAGHRCLTAVMLES